VASRSAGRSRARYGFYVAMGVVEEKSSRVVEVLLSAIRRATCWPAR
jgi:hypothetical protein